MRFFLVSIAKIELFCCKNKKKTIVFSQPFPQPFPFFATVPKKIS